MSCGAPAGENNSHPENSVSASMFYASGGHISFNSERNMEKNAAKNQWFLDFPCPITTAV